MTSSRDRKNYDPSRRGLLIGLAAIPVAACADTAEDCAPQALASRTVHTGDLDGGLWSEDDGVSLDGGLWDQ